MKFRGSQLEKVLGKVMFIPFLLLAFGLGYLLNSGGTVDAPAAAESAAGGESAVAAPEPVQVWTCSMHPQVRQPKPGKCPICFMDLIPVSEGSGVAAVGPRQIRLTESARRLAEVRTAPVRRAAASATATLRLPGKVEYDERRITTITAWVGGRIEKLWFTFTGDVVEAGAPMAEIYSPELLATQEELLQSIAAAEQLQDSSLESIRRSAGATIDAVREKLRLLGLSREQIAAIEQSGAARETIRIKAPAGGVVIDKPAREGMYVQTGTPLYTLADLSTVWVMLDAYEPDLAHLRVGQSVRFTASAWPGRTFQGRVSFIDPFIDPQTRTADVRLDVKNDHGRLKPEMLVTGEVRIGGGGQALVIPETAPLITGRRAVVYVAVPDEDNLFEGREVVLGTKLADAWEVRSGLSEGEEVVINGAFKIDSALQILAKPSMMSPAGAPATADHRHAAGGDEATPPAAPEATPREADELPAGFAERLADLYRAYFAIQQALSQDNLAAVRPPAEQLAAAAQAPPAALSAAAASFWRREAGIMSRSAQLIGEATDIATARAAFLNLSNAAIRTVRHLGSAGPPAIYQFNCPMANNNQGADWLQDHDGVENPYYGASMFKCGARTAVFPTGGKSE
ncbi:MAG: efflux RND transporter periplasmic adaptor subunit [Acidobacteria bacterium]|nr:efflux RND transporter periplasmic adaptor subunit [Acidobacteriota bacterium]